MDWVACAMGIGIGVVAVIGRVIHVYHVGVSAIARRGDTAAGFWVTGFLDCGCCVSGICVSGLPVARTV